MKFKNTLTVDPGFNTGWCYWVTGSIYHTGQITLPKIPKRTEKQKVNFMWDGFLDLLRLCGNLDTVVIEGVANYHSNASKAANAAGDLFTLSYLIGGYMGACHGCGIEDVRLVTAPQWKGQLTKAMTAQRVRLALKETFPSDHITDAVAIGLSLQGRL